VSGCRSSLSRSLHFLFPPRINPAIKQIFRIAKSSRFFGYFLVCNTEPHAFIRVFVTLNFFFGPYFRLVFAGLVVVASGRSALASKEPIILKVAPASAPSGN
jgi:hypothetical protein